MRSGSECLYVKQKADPIGAEWTPLSVPGTALHLSAFVIPLSDFPILIPGSERKIIWVKDNVKTAKFLNYQIPFVSNII